MDAICIALLTNPKTPLKAERRLKELVEGEREVFADAVNNHQVSMYAIQQATADAGVRISQQGVRKLISNA